MCERIHAPTYLLHTPHGKMLPCGVSVWLMDKEAKVSALVALIEVDCESSVDVSRGEGLWLDEAHRDATYLILVWTTMVESEIVGAIQDTIRDYGGTLCPWDKTATVELADDTMRVVEEGLRSINEQGALN